MEEQITDLTTLKLTELRNLYSSIKSISKADFIEQIYTKGYKKRETEIIVDTPIEVLQQRERIEKYVPKSLITAIGVETGCECLVENVSYFMEVVPRVTVEMETALREAMFLAFGKRVKKTGCGSCLLNRIEMLREFYEKKDLC